MSDTARVDDGPDQVLCHLYKVFYGDLPSCGCGNPEEAIRLVYELLLLAPFYENQRWRNVEELIGTPGAVHIVLSALDDAGLIEHGSVITGSWLTERGRWVLWAVDQVGGIDDLDGKLNEFPHCEPPDYRQGECTEACWAVPDGWRPSGPVPVEAPRVTACPGPSCARYLYGVQHEHLGEGQ